MKKSDPQTRLQLENLSADGRLLNAIRDMARRRAYPMMFGDIIKEFEVVDVHVLEALIGEYAIGPVHFTGVHFIFQSGPCAFGGPAENLGKL